MTKNISKRFAQYFAILLFKHECSPIYLYFTVEVYYLILYYIYILENVYII